MHENNLVILCPQTITKILSLICQNAKVLKSNTIISLRKGELEKIPREMYFD